MSLSEHALVANQQEGLLLALGGCLTSGDRRHRQTRMADQVRSTSSGKGVSVYEATTGAAWKAAEAMMAAAMAELRTF